MCNLSELVNSEIIVTTFRFPFLLVRQEDGTVVRRECTDEWAISLGQLVTEQDGQWVGWAGPGLERGQPIPPADAGLTTTTAKLTGNQVHPVFLDQMDTDLAYTGCCKAGIWPLFHSMADCSVFNEEQWTAYRRVNHLFALATVEALKKLLAKNPGCVPSIWVLDYHLMEVPGIIRRICQEDRLPCNIGFFMNIPFPHWDIIKIHPKKDIFLQGILGSDLVGLQCDDYVLNFLDCCERGLGTRVERKLGIVEHDAGGRNVKVRSLPVGASFQKFSQLALTTPQSTFLQKNNAIVLCIDSVDFTSGLTHRLQAYETFLDKYPIHRGRVILVQLCLPSRSERSSQLTDSLNTQAHYINNKYGTGSWTPVQLVNRSSLSDLDLVSLYRDADVALLTPLREGMNMYAKEFVSCRIEPSKPGVLILSPFIGSSELMQEAVLVNPYEVSKVADYLHNALTMSEAEAEVRMTSLRSREKSNDINNWIKSFTRELVMHGYSGEKQAVCRGSETLQQRDFNSILHKYLGQPGWDRLCLLLDYDGTLAPHGAHPDLTVLPRRTKEVLERLADMPEVFIAVITGRSIPDIKGKVPIKNITYAGNHGIDIVYPDGTKYTTPMPAETVEKAAWLLKRLQEECCVDGAWMENKGVVIAFHHEAWKEKGSIDPVRKEKILSRACQLMTEAGFRIGRSDGGLVTEAKPPVKWNKGNAAIHILRSVFGGNWSDRIRILYAGDDLTDEDAMQALKGLAFSFRVVTSGLVETSANHRLPDTMCVQTMLEWVENFVLRRRK